MPAWGLRAELRTERCRRCRRGRPCLRQGRTEMTRQEIEELIYGKQEQQRRFTQDFPILPDVWIAFAEKREENQPEKRKERIELLLTPYSPTTAATLSRALRERLKKERPAIERYRARYPPTDPEFKPRPRILFNDSVVFADFTFEELIRVA